MFKKLPHQKGRKKNKLRTFGKKKQRSLPGALKLRSLSLLACSFTHRIVFYNDEDQCPELGSPDAPCTRNPRDK